MPNWCNNTVEVYHKDPAKLQSLVEAVNEGKFCNWAIPVPESLHIVAGSVGGPEDEAQKKLVEDTKRNILEHGYGNWYDFCVNEWGTKWDVSPYDTVEFNPNGVTFGFDSAWAPPVGVYQELLEQGFEVRAYYYEPGMAYVGKWDNGHDDYIEYGDTNSETVRDVIGEELDDMFGISESMAEYEADED